MAKKTDTKDAPAAKDAKATKADSSETPKKEPAGASTVEPEAPFGWDVVGSDGRRIQRGVSKSEADDTASRVRINTGGEKVKVVPSDPRDLGAGKTQADLQQVPAQTESGDPAPVT